MDCWLISFYCLLYEHTPACVSICLLKKILIVLGTMSKAAVNVHMHVLCRSKFSYQLGKYLGIQLLDCRVRLCLTLEETANCLSGYSISFAYHLVYSVTFDFIHSSRYVLICNPFMTSDVEHLFIYLAVAICISSLVNCPSLWLFFNGIV